MAEVFKIGFQSSDVSMKNKNVLKPIRLLYKVFHVALKYICRFLTWYVYVIEII